MNLNNLKYSIIIILIATSLYKGNKNSYQYFSDQKCPISRAKDITLKKTNYYIVGNFEGKGEDTIFFHYYSHRLKKEINQIPSPDNDWEDIIVWFTNFQIETFFSYKKDTLKIGVAYGLHCLLNIGDINSDGKDEVAFVVDWLDYSRLNSCNIYTICQSQFYLLKTFTINEYVFDSPISDTKDSQIGINVFLKKKESVWYYCCYDEDFPVMKPLSLDKCH